MPEAALNCGLGSHRIGFHRLREERIGELSMRWDQACEPTIQVCSVLDKSPLCNQSLPPYHPTSLAVRGRTRLRA